MPVIEKPTTKINAQAHKEEWERSMQDEKPLGVAEGLFCVFVFYAGVAAVLLAIYMIIRPVFQK